MSVQKEYTMADYKTTRESTVELLDCAGDDARVVLAARTSTSEELAIDKVMHNQLPQAEFDARQKDHAGLINYLMMHRHGTPFEQSWLQFYIRAPIFVWREFHRHRIGWSYNEESGRYKQLAPEFYLPPHTRPMFQNANFKPGRPKFFTIDEVENGSGKFEDLCNNLENTYQLGYRMYLDNLKAMNFDPGLARDCLPVGIFSTCIVACNPRSLMAFLSLRTHEPTAKYVSYPLFEIEEVARKIETLFKDRFPITYKAFCDNGRVGP